MWSGLEATDSAAGAVSDRWRTALEGCVSSAARALVRAWDTRHDDAWLGLIAVPLAMMATGLKSDWFSLSLNGVGYAQSASFVRALYNDVLGRQPADSEVAAWANQVAAGADRSVVASKFLVSRENWTSMITSAYQGALHRAPEDGGIQTWLGFLSTGASINDLNAAVYGSEESFLVQGHGDNAQWVDVMYQGLLGRSAGPEERTYWTGVAGTLGRRFAAFQISASVEARERRRIVDRGRPMCWSACLTQRRCRAQRGFLGVRRGSPALPAARAAPPSRRRHAHQAR